MDKNSQFGFPGSMFMSVSFSFFISACLSLLSSLFFFSFSTSLTTLERRLLLLFRPVVSIPIPSRSSSFSSGGEIFGGGGGFAREGGATGTRPFRPNRGRDEEGVFTIAGDFDGNGKLGEFGFGIFPLELEFEEIDGEFGSVSNGRELRKIENLRIEMDASAFRDPVSGTN